MTHHSEWLVWAVAVCGLVVPAASRAASAEQRPSPRPWPALDARLTDGMGLPRWRRDETKRIPSLEPLVAELRGSLRLGPPTTDLRPSRLLVRHTWRAAHSQGEMGLGAYPSAMDAQCSLASRLQWATSVLEAAKHDGRSVGDVGFVFPGQVMGTRFNVCFHIQASGTHEDARTQAALRVAARVDRMLAKLAVDAASLRAPITPRVVEGPADPLKLAVGREATARFLIAARGAPQALAVIYPGSAVRPRPPVVRLEGTRYVCTTPLAPKAPGPFWLQLLVLDGHAIGVSWVRGQVAERLRDPEAPRQAPPDPQPPQPR